MCGSQPPEVRPVASRARPSATSSCCWCRMDASAKRQIPSVETRWNPRVPDPSAASPGGTFGVRAVHWSLHCLPSVKHKPFSGHCLPPSQPSCPRCRPGAPSSDPRSPWGPSTTPTSWRGSQAAAGGEAVGEAGAPGVPRTCSQQGAPPGVQVEAAIHGFVSRVA